MPQDPFGPQDENNPYANLEHGALPHEGMPKLSGLSITSFVLGILFLCVPLAGLIPLIMGIICLAKIANSAGRLSGKGFAVTGIVLGSVGTLLSCCSGAIVFFFWGVIGGPNTYATQLVDRENLRRISEALDDYALDHGKYPPHASELLNQGYVTDADVFLTLPNLLNGLPATQGPSEPQPVYRYGDYVFATAGQGEPRQVPPEAVLIYACKISADQRNRYVRLGSGDIIYESDAGFRKRMDEENKRRSELGASYVIDVDDFDSVP